MQTIAQPAKARQLYSPGPIHMALADPSEFGEQHLEQYRRLGFVAIQNLFSPPQVRDAHGGLSHLIAGGNPTFGGINFEKGVDVSQLDVRQREPFVRKLMNFVNYDQRLKAMAEHPALLDIVRRLIGTEVTMIQDMALLKPPCGREKPWHQDAAYFLHEPADLIVGTWTALDEATVENGCMHVIPGSHLEGPRAHYHDRDCQIPDDEVQTDRQVLVPLKPGGTLFFSGLLHHGTPPNESAVGRRALQFHYASVRCRKIEGSEHAKRFRDRDGFAGCTGLPLRSISQRAPAGQGENQSSR